MSDSPKSEPSVESSVTEEAVKPDLSAEEIEKLRIKCDSLKIEGNAKFKDKCLDEAIGFYTQAIDLCPDEDVKERSVLFNNRAAAYFHKHGDNDYSEEKEDEVGEESSKSREGLTGMDEKEDQSPLGNLSKKKPNYLDKCVEDCATSIDLNPSYVKPYLKRAQAYRKMGKDKLDAALEDYEMVIKIDPSIKESHQAIQELKVEIEKRNEELKNEMIGKLKDIGNVVLNKFGLSTDNFQMVKNPETGGYSINFKS